MTGPFTATSPLTAYSQLLALELGDLVTLPDGRDLSVRAMEPRLAVPSGSMHGFVLAGEIGPQATLLSVPGGPDGPVHMYTPVDEVPANLRQVALTCEGVVSYWSPHVANLSGAMGELSYRIFRVRGQVEPLVILWRAAERIVFTLSGTARASELAFLHMSRDPAQTEVDVVRHTARVTNPAHVPVTVGEAVPADLYRRFTRS